MEANRMTLADSQRRTLLRGLFAALVVLPIVATVVWAVVLRSDTYRKAWEDGLSPALGMRVTIDAVRHPRPGTTLFEGFRCYDPETDALVLECRTLESEDFTDGRHLRASQPQIYADRAARLFGALERRLRREDRTLDMAVTLAAEELTWIAGGGSQTLVDVAALAGPADGAQQLLVNFRLPGSTAAEPISVRISRRPDGDRATTSIEVDTATTPLPCAPLTPITSLAEALGPQSRFTGRVKVRQTADGWDGVATGDLSEADLDTLVAQRFPHMLSGTAEVRIHRAEFDRSRLQRANLTIVAGPGQIGRSLVTAGGYFLGFGVSESQLPSDSMLLFDRFACDVSMDGGALNVKARTAERPGAILWKDDLTYWREPAGDGQHAANLLRALVPFSELQVPAALQTAGLMQWLPLAKPGTVQLQATANPDAPPPAPRMRVRETP